MTARPERPAATAGRMPLSAHVWRSTRLAAPVMLGRAGLIVMISVDSIMTGHAGAAELAFYAISLAPHTTLLVLGIGLLVGTVILTAQSDGAGRRADAGPIWLTSLWISAGMGTLGGLILLSGPHLLLAIGQSPSLAAGGGRALVMSALGMPAILMYIATTFFLEGLGRPTPGMVVALSANLLNGALNWALIYGNLGAPEMGAAGASLATSITRWVMLAALIGYALGMTDRAGHGLDRGLRGGLAIARKLLRVGAPLSVAAGLETASFATVATFAGRLGEVPLAAYQIAFNIVTLAFMLAIGLSNATSIRVANAVGRADRAGMATAGWVGIGLVGILMVLVAGAIRATDDWIAQLYSNDVGVVALAVPALAVTGMIVVVDGVQAVVLGALRGTGDVMVPTLCHAISFWAVAVPAAYLLGLRGPAGVNGLFWGLFLGLVCAVVLLSWRFAIVARRTVRPM